MNDIPDSWSGRTYPLLSPRGGARLSVGRDDGRSPTRHIS